MSIPIRRSGDEGRAVRTAARQTALAEAARLDAHGFPRPQICAHLGVSIRTLHRYLAEHRDNDQGAVVTDLKSAMDQMTVQGIPRAETPAKEKPEKRYYNGRELADWEIEIIEDGYKRDAEAGRAVLGERAQRKVA